MGTCLNCNTVFTTTKTLNKRLCSKCDSDDNYFEAINKESKKAEFIKLTNFKNSTKTAPLGFCYTCLFFSFLIPFWRNDMKYSAIMFIGIAFAVGMQQVNENFGMFLVYVNLFGFAFVYNKLYIKNLLKQKYYGADDISIAVIANQFIKD